MLRAFTATRPDTKWLCDFTYASTSIATDAAGDQGFSRFVINRIRGDLIGQCPLDRLGQGLVLAHPPRGPPDVEHDRPVHETIENGRGNHGIAEYLADRTPAEGEEAYCAAVAHVPLA